MPTLENLPALRDAINNAPSDATEFEEITHEAQRAIGRWNTPGSSLTGSPQGTRFGILYDRTIGILNGIPEFDTTSTKFQRAIFTGAMEIANHRMLYQFPGDVDFNGELEKAEALLKQYERQYNGAMAIAALHLLQNYLDPQNKCEDAAKGKTLQEISEIENETLSQVGARLDEMFPETPHIALAFRRMAKEVVSESPVQKYIDREIKAAKRKMERSKNPNVVRFMAEFFHKVEDYCRVQGVENPLVNLSIGDVYGKNLPILLRERLGLNPFGPKSAKIAERSRVYLQAMESFFENSESGGINTFGYDIKALGRKGLRDKFIEYAKDNGLYDDPSEVKGSIIGAAGSQSLKKAFISARKYLEDRMGKGKKFAACFANPGLQLIPELVKEAGLKTIDFPSRQENSFFPDHRELNDFFTANPNCKIYINVPISNPNATIIPPQQMENILRVLKKHKIILINDLAYLGLGDDEKSREVCELSKNYKRRIDVIPMTKIFARPGLRCGCAITPDRKLAQYFVPVGQTFQPTESYAMQAEAMAIWDLVDKNDRRALAMHFQERQNKLLGYLRKYPALFNFEKPCFSDAGIYLFVPLANGTDAFKIIKETGLVGSPEEGFLKRGGKKSGYIRFAIGAQEIPDVENS